jgi:voltage-gated potassium channel
MTSEHPQEKPERRTFEDIPSWKDVGCGYGTKENNKI